MHFYSNYLFTDYNLDLFCTDFMSFSSLSACAMSPLIFSLPPMKACMELSSPRNILVKSPLSMIIVHEATISSDASLVTLPMIKKIFLCKSIKCFEFLTVYFTFCFLAGNSMIAGIDFVENTKIMTTCGRNIVKLNEYK